LSVLARIEVSVSPLDKRLWFEQLILRRMQVDRLRGQSAALYVAFTPALLAKAFRGIYEIHTSKSDDYH